MNLHGIANGYIQIVNPNRLVTLKRFAGMTQDANYERTPSYSTSTINAQLQALSSEMLKTLNNMNLQGHMQSVITTEALRPASRTDQLGGDMLNFDGHDWLVVHIVETFPDHTVSVVQKQV